MPELVRQDLPATEHIAFGTSADQFLVIRKAAELIGWTVTEYVLSAALDRAERDLYEHAAAVEAATPPTPRTRPALSSHSSPHWPDAFSAAKPRQGPYALPMPTPLTAIQHARRYCRPSTATPSGNYQAAGSPGTGGRPWTTRSPPFPYQR